jgi:hypothetical protein
MNVRLVTAHDAEEFVRLRLEALTREPYAFGRAPEDALPWPPESVGARWAGQEWVVRTRRRQQRRLRERFLRSTALMPRAAMRQRTVASPPCPRRLVRHGN